jgi:hypothetical protein
LAHESGTGTTAFRERTVSRCYAHSRTARNREIHRKFKPSADGMPLAATAANRAIVLRSE